MLIMAFGCIFIAIVYIWLLKWITKPMLYTSMLFILIGFILLGAWAWMHKDDFPEGSDERKQNQIFAIVAWVLAFAYSICVCCCWSNIRLGASVMESASDFVSSNLRIIFLPIVAYIISMVFFVFWISVALYLYSIGTVTFKERSVLANIEWSDQTKYIMWYNLFGLLWVVAFCICMQQFIIAAMTCMWYFSGAGG